MWSALVQCELLTQRRLAADVQLHAHEKLERAIRPPHRRHMQRVHEAGAVLPAARQQHSGDGKRPWPSLQLE
jgi:hypothetical protein